MGDPAVAATVIPGPSTPCPTRTPHQGIFSTLLQLPPSISRSTVRSELALVAAGHCA